MKWFKHDANAILDSKLKRVRLKYGMEGYGLYWYCLESVARNVETHNLTFELEEDAELIAADTNIHYERVEEMMRYFVSLNLFEASEGRITCLKMASRADEYTQKLLRERPLKQLSEQCADSVPTKSLLLEQNRTEQKEENRTDINLCERDFIISQHKRIFARPISPAEFAKFGYLMQFPEDKVEKAFTAAKGKKSLNYVISILENDKPDKPKKGRLRK